MNESNYFETEPTRQYLIKFLKETETLIEQTLHQYDKSASCKIYPSLDLGFPHDLIRIAGGFATGSFITWDSDVPFIPVDTTVNVCTSSIFGLDGYNADVLDEDFFDDVMKKLEDSSYYLNFHRGNHFISFTRSANTGQTYLILHTSASEFKKTYNGLFPVIGNWFMEDLKVFRNGDRRMRYIIGQKAEVFARIAHHIEDYNAMRHNFFAETLTDRLCTIEDEKHFHHYYMPTDQSVMIGSFLLNANEVAPIFSYPGDPIFLYEPYPAEKNSMDIDGETKYLVPHGWGKTSLVAPQVTIDLDKLEYQLNGVVYSIDTNSSLRAHPDLELRRFNTNENVEDFYFNLISDYCDGVVIDKLEQEVSYNKSGVIDWRNTD